MNVKELQAMVKTGDAQVVKLKCIRIPKEKALYFYCEDGAGKVYIWDDGVWVEQEDK